MDAHDHNNTTANRYHSGTSETSEETASNQNNEDRNATVTNNQGATYTDTQPVDTIA